MPRTYSTFEGKKAPQMINTDTIEIDTQKTAVNLSDLIVRPPYYFFQNACSIT